MSIVNCMSILLILLIRVSTIRGSHFDGGSISYQVVGTNGSKLVVRIIQSYTYVYPTIYCNNSYIINQWTLPLSPFGDATDTLNCIANCATKGGYTSIPVATKCTDYSVGMSITVGQRTDDVLISNGSYFSVAYQESAFRNLNLPGSGGSTLGWSISALIDLRMRSDGTYNTPPKATMISPIYIPVGVQQKISIPTIDEDNDNVRCRYASGANECADVCPPSSLPSGTSISSSCVLTITGAKAGDWYAVAIQAEDFANSTTTTPFSSVPVQFLVHVYAQPNCTQRPYLYGPSLDGTCTSVQVGVPYTMTLYAENYCSSYNVTMVDIATQSFPIVVKTPIVQNTSTLWSISLTWTPTANEVGSQVFCSVGIDSESVQTNQYCLTFSVGSGTMGVCPGVEITTTEEMATTQAPTTQAPTTQAPTTQAPTTQAPTTQPPTTTTTVANTTTANNTSPDMTVVIVPVIIIPICCCCCCWWLYCCIRPCRTVDVEEEKKPVTTYTIEGAYINKDSSLIDATYEINENDPNNNDPLTDTSYVTFHDTSFDTEPPPAKYLRPMNNGHNGFLPATHKNMPVTPDTTFINTDGDKMTMHRDPFPLSPSIFENAQPVSNRTGNNIYGIQTKTNYDRHPPPQLSTPMTTSSTPASIRSNTYGDNSQQPIDSLHSTSLSRPTSASNLHLQLNDDLQQLNTRQALRPWTKHARWVLRLSQPRQIHTGPLTNDQPFSRERPTNYSSSSSRSTATIPRYAFVEE